MINKVVLVYILWIVSHYIATHAYVQLCTPLTIKGFLLSPLLTSAPHCKALEWVIHNGSHNIHLMWVLFGAVIHNRIAPAA